MSATKIRQLSELSHTFAIPLDEVWALLPATARESLAGWELNCYTDTKDGSDGEADSLIVTFSQKREFVPDASGKMVEKPNGPRDFCARKSEVLGMIETALGPIEEALGAKREPPKEPGA